MSDIPLTNCYGQQPENVLGWISLTPNKVWEVFKKNPDAFRFEPAYFEHEDGTVELLEISLVPNQKAPSMALDDLIDDL